MKIRGIIQFIAGFGACIALLAVVGASHTPATNSPVTALPDREVYYPGSEDLGPDEMRIIACGTGMPNQRRSSERGFPIGRDSEDGLGIGRPAILGDAWVMEK